MDISGSGCGITSLAMILSYYLDTEVDVVDLAEKYLGTYYSGAKGGTNAELFTKGLVEELGIRATRYERNQEFNNNDVVMNALRNGQPVIIWVGKGAFTSSGHYMVLSGIQEYVNENGQVEERIIIQDTNGSNYQSNDQRLQDGFANGFKQSDFSNGFLSNSVYYVFDSKEEVQNNLTTEDKYKFLNNLRNKGNNSDKKLINDVIKKQR